MNTGQSAPNWRENNTTSNSQQEGGSSHDATGKGQSFREQEEEDYGDEADANIFEKTTIPPENYKGTSSDLNGHNQYYDEEGGSYGREENQ